MVLGVRKHLANGGDVGRVHQRELLELAHAAGALRAEQVALARVRANDLAGRSDLEALRGAAMSLQLLLWLRCVAWHCFNPFQRGPTPTAQISDPLKTTGLAERSLSAEQRVSREHRNPSS